jgi:hypothetical protein
MKYKLYQFCHTQQKVVPIEEVRRETWARDLFIQDDMEPTRNPLNPKEIFTSKSELRKRYREAGVVEVGDAYERGYKPDRETGRSERELVTKLKNQMIDRYRNG